MRGRLFCILTYLVFPLFIFAQDNTLLFPGDKGVVVDLGNIEEISNVQHLTIEFWVNFQTQSPSDYFLSIDGDNYDLEFSLGQPWSELQVLMQNATVPTIANLVYPSEWFFLTVVFDGTLPEAERLKIYLNGIEQTGAINGTVPTHTPTISLTNAITIGKGIATNSKEFNGYMDDFVIWSTSRTNTEVLYDMNNPPECEDSTVVCYLPFDETDGTTIVSDCTHNGNDGNLVGFPVSSFYARTYSTPAVQAYRIEGWFTLEVRVRLQGQQKSPSTKVKGLVFC